MAAQAVREIEIRYSETGQREVTRNIQTVGAESRRAAEGVDRLAKAQDEGRRVTDRSATELRKVGREYDRLQRSLDGVHRAEANLSRELQTIQKATAAGLVSQARQNELIELANARYSAASEAARLYKESQLAVGKAAAFANDNVRLTGNQVKNLGFQLNDAATMLASGSSPFQVIATQSGQVIQALGDGPGGVRGSLKALATQLATTAARFAPIGLAAGAAAGAAYLVWKAASGPEVKSAEEALDRYKRTLDELKAGYEDAANAAERFFDRTREEGPNVAMASIRGTAAEIQASLAREIETLTARTQSFVTSFKDLSPAVLAGQQAIRELGDRLQSGQITAAEFRDEIAKIRIAPDTPPVVTKIADGLLDASINARDLANALGAVDAAAAAAGDKLGRLRLPAMQDETAPFGSALDMLRRVAPETFETLREGLESQADGMRKAAEATSQYGEAITNQRQAMADTVASLQAQVEGIGLTEGAAAALRFETEQLAAAQRAAAEAGKASIDPALRADIEARAEAVGDLTQKLKDQAAAQAAADKRANFLADLDFERSIAGMPQAEQAIAQRLRSQNIEMGTAQYEQLAGVMREINAANDNTIDGQKRLRKEMKSTGSVIEDVFGALINSAGDGSKAIDGLISAFARIGQANTQQGLALLSNWITGGQTAAPQAAPQFASSYHRSAGTALPPIATGEGFNAGRAASVASRSVPAQIWNFFAGKGLSSHQIAGILGNAKAESGFNFGNSSGDGGNAWGLFQWNDRRRNMVNFVGQDWRTDLNGQLEFAWKELQTSESKAYRALLKATDVVEATEAFLGFERPSGYPSGVRNSHNYSGRVQFAQDAYREFGQADMTTAVSQGTIDANRRMVAGEVPGIDAWGGLRSVTPGAEAQGLSVPQGMNELGAGMQALGAGIGAFAQGYQSGSPIMGGLSGALGGFSAGASLGPALGLATGVGGPIGAVVGGLAGLIGGLKGTAKNEKQRAKKAKAEALAACADQERIAA